MHRREFLKTSVAGAVLGTIGSLHWTQRGHAATVSVDLNAVSGDIAMQDGVNVRMLTFSTNGSPQFHGPTIVCEEGDTVDINLNNTLNTTVVFAVADTGVRVSVGAGQSSNFSFSAPNAGTYLYYDDQNNGVNRVMGLNGALVVMPSGISNQPFSGGPTFVRQYKWALHSLDSAWGDTLASNGDGAVAGINPTSFQPRYFTINGSSYPDTHHPDSEVEGNFGEAALIRIINSGGMIHSPHFHGNHVEIVSVNHNNFASGRKEKDIVSMFPRDTRDVLFPCKKPPDAWPPVTTAQHFPMHCHSEMSQTLAGGHYPHGMHAAMVIGHSPNIEPEL